MLKKMITPIEDMLKLLFREVRLLSPYIFCARRYYVSWF